MSSGFGVVPLDFAGALGGIASNLTKQGERQRRLDTLSQLGPKLQAGDYAGGAQLLFDAGDAESGIGLLKLGQAYAKDQRIARNDALAGGFLSGLGPDGSGGYTGDASGGIGGPQSPLGTRSDRSVPSFTSNDGAIGSYLAGTRAKESGGNDQAANPNSTAFGRYQITRDTWDGLARRNPDLGLTPDGRSDPAQQERAMARLTDENARSLSSAGITINPQSLYGAHFLGAPGFKRFYFGTNNNPDAPATAYVGPGVAAANRSVFYGKDGTPKRAAEVLDWMGRGYGGGRVAAAPGSRPAAPRVEVAENEAETQALERRLGMLPADALAYDPRADMPAEGAVPTIAQAPSGFGVPPLASGGFQRPLPSSDPNARNVPPSPVQGGGLTGAPQSVRASDVPPSANSDTWVGSNAPPGRMSPLAPAPTLGGGVPDRVMQMPGEGPVQIAQAAGAPDLSSPAGRREAAQMRQVDYIGGLPSNQRLSKLLALSTLEMSDGPRAAVQAMLKQALDESAIPQDAKVYLWARKTGQTQARNLAEFKQEMAGPKTLAPGSSLVGADGRIITTAPDRERDNKVAADIEARSAAAAQYGLQPGSPAYQSFVLSGKMPREDQQPLSASDKRAILEADDGVASAETAISNLTQAKALSAKAYAGPLAGWRGWATGTLGSEAGQATQELDNLITTNALGQLKAIFGAAPTEGERKILLEIQGSSNLPHALRVKIYDRATELAERRLDLNRQRAAELRGQTYYKPGGGAPGARSPGASRALPAPSPSNRPGAANAADRFGELTASGLSKEQAYQRLQSEGY